MLTTCYPRYRSDGYNRIQNILGVNMPKAINMMNRSFADSGEAGPRKMPMVDRTPTGIPGLDEILSGGFPRRRVVLIVGGPGTGKTILTSQFLINGIKM